MEQREKNWNKRYLDKDYPWEEEAPSYEIKTLLETYCKENLKILEIGCGLGTNALFMAKLGHSVKAVDISVESIELAKRRATQGDGPNFAQLDFMNDPLNEKFDVVFERGVLHTFFDQEGFNAFAKKVAEKLNNGGLWITISGNADNPEDLEERGSKKYPRITARNISLAAEPYFEILELKRGIFGKKNHFHSWTGVFSKRHFFYE